MDNQQNTHWSEYWAAGALTSLPQDFKVNYDGEVADFWHSVLAELHDGAKILDVCSGNLALPLLFAEYAERQAVNFSITAVDLAKIDKSVVAKRFPKQAGLIEQIELLSETAIEQIDRHLSGSFDLISSQYGLEYCDLEVVAEKLAQLLKPNGRLAFVSHAADTAILSLMRAENEAFGQLQGIGVFDILADFGSGSSKAAQLQKQLPKLLNQVGDLLRAKPNQLSQVIYQALQGLSRLSLAQLLREKQAIGAFVRQHLSANLRTKDLLQVSEKIIAEPNWYSVFTQKGLLLQQQGQILYRNRHNAGHFYIFTKP